MTSPAFHAKTKYSHCLDFDFICRLKTYVMTWKYVKRSGHLREFEFKINVFIHLYVYVHVYVYIYIESTPLVTDKNQFCGT